MAPPRLSTMARKQVQRQARRLKRQSNQQPSASMPAAQQMRSLLGREVEVPDSLLPACNLLYLAEVAPANRLPL